VTMTASSLWLVIMPYGGGGAPGVPGAPWALSPP
jgi:hypothetical protein